MDKAQMITLYYLLSKDNSHLETLSDFIEQFEVVEANIRDLLENRKQS